MNLLLVAPLTLLFALLACCWSTVPGIHVYNVVILVHVAIYALPFELPAIALIAGTAAMLSAGAITSALPSLLLAPADDSATLLASPGRDALRAGSAPSALLATAAGGALALLLTLLPGIWLAGRVGPYVWQALRSHLHWIIWALIVYLAMSEWSASALMESSPHARFRSCWRPLLVGLLCLLLSGSLGIIAFGGDWSDPYRAAHSLLPFFAGLFSLPASLFAIVVPSTLPPQKYDNDHPTPQELTLGTLQGVGAGTVAAFLPAVSAGIASLLTGNTLRGRRTFLVAHGALRTSYYVGAFLLLWIPVLRLCRGAPANLVASRVAAGSGSLLLAALGGAALGGAVALHLLPHLLHTLLSVAARHGPRSLHVASIALVALTVILLTGAGGMLLLLVATGIGLLPLLYGCRRLSLLAAVLLPLALRFSRVAS